MRDGTDRPQREIPGQLTSLTHAAPKQSTMGGHREGIEMEEWILSLFSSYLAYSSETGSRKRDPFHPLTSLTPLLPGHVSFLGGRE